MSQPQESSGRRVVVGVDGSPSSEAALRWAVQFAEKTGAGVTAVCAWQYPAEFIHGITPPSSPEVWHPDADARQVLDDTVRTVLGERRPPGFETLACEGHPAQVLVEQSADAELLVVGSRGRGGFTGMLLGSVSSTCAAHARCPVLIIREQ